MVKAVKARFKEASPVLPSREGGQTARISFCKNSILKIQRSKLLVDIICTIVQWRISATFSKGVKGGIL